MTARFARATWIRRASSASAQVRVARTGNNVIDASLAIRIAPLYRGLWLLNRLDFWKLTNPNYVTLVDGGLAPKQKAANGD